MAPAYPGDTKEASELATRADAAKVSCWTIDQLATVVENIESRHITATVVLDVVLSCFAPKAVTKRLDDILKTPGWKHQDLYRAIVAALRDLEQMAPDALRDVSMVLGRLAATPGLMSIRQQDVAEALAQLAAASKGALTYRPDGRIVLHVGWDEIDRRVSALTGVAGPPRKPGRFHK